ncbi:MAG: hypothetical protein HY897_23000 [Deltaproteobacteria bacterium]|nr:hypothetical protein [Deltaproteobacteria bacterium]
MRIRPARKYPNPAYPAYRLVADNPDVLSRHVPAAWLRNEIVVGALAAFTLGGCRSNVTVEAIPPATAGQQKPDAGAGGSCGEAWTPERRIETFGGTVEFKPAKTGVRKKTAVKIAPLFIHGKGAGSTGCVAIAPPVFMSEDAARDIVIGEMKAAGIDFDRTDVDAVDEKMSDSAEGPLKDFLLDGYSTKLRLGFEFVSMEDFARFGGVHSRSTVQRYDLKTCAENARSVLGDHFKVNVAIFYDPMTNVDMGRGRKERNYPAAEKEARLDSATDLTAQVRDFIAWAKREGVLK